MVLVIILNWNGKLLTAECLHSLFMSDLKDMSVIVVDNGSEDGSAEYLAETFPQVELLRSETNLGFTGGNNLALRHAVQNHEQFDYIFLLNNDTVIAPDCISKLVSFAQHNPGYAALTPKVFFYEPSDVIWFAGGKFSLWTGIPHHRGYKQKDTGQFDGKETTISFANGCALLLVAPILVQIDGLDETLFSYAEDVDLSLRIQKLGYKLGFVSDAHVWHKVGMSLSSRSGQAKRYYYYIRNTLYVITKHSTVIQRIFAYPIFLGHALLTMGSKSILRGRFEEVVALWRGAIDSARLWKEKHP